MSSYLDSKLKVKASARARCFTLRLNYRDRCIDLIMPKRASKSQALMFARKNSDWISEKLDSLPQPVPFAEGAVLPILGENTLIKITQNPVRKTTSVKLNTSDLQQAILEVTTNKDDPSARIKRYLKTLAKQRLADMVSDKADQIGKDVKAIRIGDMTSRWGSCSSQGDVSLSWRLIFAPFEACDYVVAHEVAHLKHLDHSPRFWRLCENLSLNYKEGKTWIKDNGYTLMRYG